MLIMWPILKKFHLDSSVRNVDAYVFSLVFPSLIVLSIFPSVLMPHKDTH
jgi:hypothetical protein